MTNPFKIHIDGEENAIYRGGTNHFKNGEAVGGKMVLFQNELVFKSHQFNVQRHELHIPLAEIADLTPYNFFRFVPTGLKITLCNGQTENLVVNKRNTWIDAILATKALNA